MTSRPFIKMHRRDAQRSFLCRAAEMPARHKKHPSGSFPSPPRGHPFPFSDRLLGSLPEKTFRILSPRDDIPKRSLETGPFMPRRGTGYQPRASPWDGRISPILPFFKLRRGVPQPLMSRSHAMGGLLKHGVSALWRLCFHYNCRSDPGRRPGLSCFALLGRPPRTQAVTSGCERIPHFVEAACAPAPHRALTLFSSQTPPTDIFGSAPKQPPMASAAFETRVRWAQPLTAFSTAA